MRKTLWRLLTSTAFALAGFAPAVVIAVWGVSYVVQCIQTLTAPGVPVEYRYESEVGTMVVHAESYQFDLSTMEGNAMRARVYGPDGEEVVTSENIEVSYRNNVLAVRLDEPVLNIKRLSDGTFDLLRMLPKETTEEPPRIAVRVATNRALLRYSDQTVEDAPLDVVLSDVVVESGGGDTMFRATMRGDVTGNFAGSFSRDGRLFAALRVDEYDLARPLPYIRPYLDRNSLGEFADLSADELAIDGTAQLWWSEDDARFAGSFRVDGTGLRTRDTLRGATVHANIVGDGESAQLIGSATQPGFAIEFDGNLGLGEHIRLVGNTTANASSRSSLPPQLRDLIDPGIEFEGASYEGFVDTDFEQYFIDGEFDVASATYAGETTTDAAGRVRLSTENIFARFDRGTWAGVDYSGTLAVDFDSGAITGGLQTERGRIEPLAEHFGIDQLSGILTANVVLTGTVEEPNAEIYGRGSAGVQLTEGPLTYLGTYELRGRLNNRGLFMERLVTSGPNGVITGEGSLMWEDGALDLHIVGGGLDLSSADDRLDGLAFFNAAVSGTRDAPEANGRVEVYGLSVYGRGVPQLVADWTADSERLNIERVAARAGTGQIDGFASMTWGDHVIAGQFGGRDLRLEEWVAKETIGAINIVDGTISGTLEQPRVSARLAGEGLYAGGINLDMVDVLLRADETGLYSDSILVRAGGGELEGTGAFWFESRAGRLDATVTDFSLASIPLGEYALALDGLASGEIHAQFTDEQIVDATLAANVAMVNVNGTPVGQGTVDASFDGRTVGLEARIGSLERYIMLTGGVYDTVSETIGGEIDVFDILIQDIVEAFGEAMEGWPASVKDLFESTSGLARIGVDLSGPAKDPDVVVRSLTLDDLTVRGRDAGILTARGRRDDRTWTIEAFEWRNGQTLFTAAGSVTEEGAYTVSGSLSEMQAAWLNTLFPAVPIMAGYLSIPQYAVSGVRDDIEGGLVLRAEGIGGGETSEGQALGTGWLDETEGRQDIQVSIANRLITVEGPVRYGTYEQPAFKGRLEGDIPISALYQREGELPQPMTLIVRLDETEFKDFGQYFTLLDPEKSDGRVNGWASIVGVAGGEFSTEAHLSLVGDTLALREQETVLRNVDAQATWMDGRVEVTGRFDGELGGDGALDINAQVPDIFSSDLRSEQILNRTSINGTIQLNNFNTRFLLPTAERASRATVTTENLTVGGSVGSPRIAGKVVFSELFIRLPQALAENATPVIYQVDPVFEGVEIVAEEGSLLDSGAARIFFFGTGRLDGSLQNPDISMPLTVTGGTFEMPTARITIESGGSIAVGYRGVLGAAPVARVDLNLEGHTTLSAPRLDNEYETYFIQLNIRGNLLGEEGLNITASSDPPDLSSEQILAMLGQKDLIESFARSGSGLDIRETLYTAALPTASTNVLSSLAREFGLDYISLDYNPFDGPVVGVGKTIGRGLMIQASRQLTPNPGEKLKYDLQLTYRLPMEDAFFSRVRVSLGLDETVPWRIRINWGRRF